MMANRITDLEAKTEEVFSLIDEYIPEQYQMGDGPLKDDPPCIAWNKALFTAADAMTSMRELAMLLRAKAGIPESESRQKLLKYLAKSNESQEAKQEPERVGVG